MPPTADEGGDGVPEVRPGLKIRRRKIGAGGAQEFGKELATLERCWFPGSHPVGKGRAALFSPMSEHRGLADAAATVDHDQLARARVCSGQNIAQKDEFRSTIDKHSVLIQKHQLD